MPALILPLAEAAVHLPARGALIGLDLGTKTIGVAASDPDRRLAAAVETIARKNFSADAARVLVLAAERQAAAFVLGLPVNMDGSEGPRAQSTRAFARNLARLTELPIALWDERLSTAAVERELIAANARAMRATVPGLLRVRRQRRIRSPVSRRIGTASPTMNTIRCHGRRKMISPPRAFSAG